MKDKIIRVIELKDNSSFTIDECRLIGDTDGDYSSRNSVGDIIKDIDNSKYDKNYFINNVNAVYRFKNLTLSRDKVSNYSETCGFKIIRDKDKADISIISEKTIEKMVNHEYFTLFTTEQFKNIYDKIQEIKDLKEEFIDLLDDLVTKCNSFNNDDYITLKSPYYWGNSINRGIYDYINALNTAQDTKYILYIKGSDNINNYKWIENNLDKLITDELFNKLCVGDSVPITKEEFKNVYKLITSPDKENVTVGMTIMANCNVDNSKTYHKR